MSGPVRTFASALAALALALPARAGAEAPEPVLVFAASSLSEVFAALGHAFARVHPPARVEQSFAGSPSLVAQVESGAPAQVIATADLASLERLSAAGLLTGRPLVFARNRLGIAVERGNPKGVTGLADLARSDLIVVLASEAVPAGGYAREALRKAGVTVEPRSLETNVKAVLQRVALGEADAGIVYASDVLGAAGRVEGIAIPDEHNALASYPIALVRQAELRADAREFVEFVLSDDGRAVLERFGFLPP